MSRSVLIGLLIVIVPGSALVLADAFDRLEGRVLAGLPGSPGAQARESLSFSDIGNMPVVLEGIRAAVLVVATDQGNPARLLVAAALRKPADAEAQPIPALVLERFDTFKAGPATTKLARGREIVLFDGFEFDLDSGQVVPEGQGGDLRFTIQGEAGPRLEPVGEAVLYTLSQPPTIEEPGTGQPSTGRQILPGDFSGRYRLVADGRWSGLLTLEVDGAGAVTGRFRSDQTGTSYRVTGQAQLDAPNHIVFAIEFPRSRQEYDARLWSEGKGALAGTVTLLERTLGFFALREGAAFTPDDAEIVDEPASTGGP